MSTSKEIKWKIVYAMYILICSASDILFRELYIIVHVFVFLGQKMLVKKR